jgi:hypothetical protein
MSPVQVYNAPDQKIGQKKLKHLSDTLKVVQTNCKSHEDTSPNGVVWQVPKFSYPPTLSNNKNLKDHLLNKNYELPTLNRNFYSLLTARVLETEKEMN